MLGIATAGTVWRVVADGTFADSKDWTWVLDRACPECGLDTRDVPAGEVAGRLRFNIAAWPEVLLRGDVRRRPDPARWSPLEYGCHVRDVFDLFDRRLALMLATEDPLFDNWDQDATAVEQRYGEQDPATVSGQLVAAGGQLVESFSRVRDDQWEPRGRRSAGAHFTVATFARYLLHDPVHHLWDVNRA